MRLLGLVLAIGLTLPGIGLFIATAGSADDLSPASAPPCRRAQLTDGTLFVPSGLTLDANGVEVTLHLHGAEWMAEQNFARARLPGVLVTVVLPGLSAVYVARFRDTNTLSRILDEVRRALTKDNTDAPVEVRRLTLTSFSAGYGGVRELLRQPAAFARIDTLVLADSLYAGFDGDPAARQVSKAHMEDFVRFAREAVSGRKRFLVTHCQLATPSYASTVETAESLIAHLGGQREATDEAWPGGLHLVSRYRRGGFEALGFAGDSGTDHMRHLQQLAVFLERAALPSFATPEQKN